MLLTVAFVSGVTVIDLLTKDDALSGFIPALQRRSTYQAHQHHKKTMILSTLTAATTEIPPPSLAEVAARLDIGRKRLLRSYAPEICDLTNQGYWTSEPGKETRRWRRKRLRSNADIKTALEAVLKQHPPPSV